MVPHSRIRDGQVVGLSLGQRQASVVLNRDPRLDRCRGEEGAATRQSRLLCEAHSLLTRAWRTEPISTQLSPIPRTFVPRPFANLRNQSRGVGLRKVLGCCSWVLKYQPRLKVSTIKSHATSINLGCMDL
jgi:hypothetical protein